MTESIKVAITAIGDVDLESSITSSLIRMGWKVELRALSFTDVHERLRHPQQTQPTLFYAPDIKGFTHLPPDIRAINVSSFPGSDFELAELIEDRAAVGVEPEFAAPIGTTVIGVGSIGRYRGASLLALNLAQESALRGSRTLLIDAHSRNPFAAGYFDLYGINRAVSEISENFFIYETPHLKRVSPLELSVNSIDVIVVDCGEISQPGESLNGRRSQDSSFSWIAHHGDELFLVINEELLNSFENNPTLMTLESLAMKPAISYLCNKFSPTKRGAREKLVAGTHGITNRPLVFLPVDTRSVAVATEERSTLALSAARSQLRREILALCDSRGWWGH